MSNGKISEEATGVFIGTLLEDMIDTVSREKKLYCDVDIPEFFSKNHSHPLTYVPFWAMSLPLKKGDKVLVEFHQNNLMYPVLYRNESDIDENFYKQFSLPTGFPSSAKTVGSTKLGENSFIIKTDNYTILRQNNAVVYLDKNNNVYLGGSNVNIICSGSGRIAIKNGNKSLFSILRSVLMKLNSSLATQGSPAAHVVVPNQFGDNLADLELLLQD